MVAMKLSDSRVMDAADQLRTELCGRLIGKTRDAWREWGPSKVSDIRMPWWDESLLGKWPQWECGLMDNRGRSWTTPLTWFVALPEVIAMFRRHFAGLPAALEHPHVNGCVIAGENGANFVPSGRMVVFNERTTSVFLRPNGKDQDPLWECAELRVDSNFGSRFSTDEPLWACNINPQDFGQPHGYGAGPYYRLLAPPKNRREMLYVPLRGPWCGRDISRHLARIVDFDPKAGTSVFELDADVEVEVEACLN